MINAVIAMLASAVATSGPVDAGSQPLPTADTPPAAAAPAKPVKKPKDPGDKIVCHDDPLTGSHLGSTVCKKQKEWDAITNASRNLLDNTNHQQMGYKPPGG
jgi:hypothetical protein